MLLRLVAAVGTIAVVLGASPEASAAPIPPLVVITGPGQHKATARAKAALTLASRRRGSAVIDLTRQPAPPSKAGLALSRGIDAYVKLRYGDAIKLLTQGVDEARRTGARSLTTTALSDLFIYRALAHTRHGNATKSWDDLVRAATIAPGRTLDPLRFPPRVVEAFGRAVKRVSASPPLSVRVAVPSGCATRVDGRAVTPKQTLAVIRGDHYLRVECPGYEPYADRVAVLTNNLTIAPKLQRPSPPSLADITALATSRGATVLALATVQVSPRAPPSLRLQLIDARTRKTILSSFAPLSGDDVTSRVAANLDRMIDRVLRPPTQPKPRIIRVPVVQPWYKRGWVWAIAGAAITAAVLTPWLLDRNDAGGQFDLQPGGSLPW